MVQKSEFFLLEQAIKRDEKAFTALHSLYALRVYRFILYRTSNHDIAKDISQEVFLRAWIKISNYRITDAPFVSWLVTIARHMVIDHYKRKKDTVPFEPETLLSQAVSVHPHIMLEENLNRATVHQAVQSLDGDKQKVVTMRYFEGLTYPEIARKLNKSEGAVRVTLFRALKDLKILLL